MMSVLLEGPNLNPNRATLTSPISPSPLGEAVLLEGGGVEE